MLKEIHIYLAVTFQGEEMDWRFTEDEPFPDLPGLRSLHIAIDRQSSESFFFDFFKRYAAFDEDYENYWETGLLIFQSYPLDKATVIVSDCLYVPTLRANLQDPDQYDDFQSRHRWTVKRKREFAERIRLRLLSPDGAQVACRSRALRLCAMRRMSRKTRLHHYGMGIVTATRSERVGMAAEKLRAFRESLSCFPIWLSEGRLDEHIASFMISGCYLHWVNSYEGFTKNEEHLYEQHLEVVANYVPGGSVIPSPAGIIGRPAEP